MTLSLLARHDLYADAFALRKTRFWVMSFGIMMFGVVNRCLDAILAGNL